MVMRLFDFGSLLYQFKTGLRSSLAGRHVGREHGQTKRLAIQGLTTSLSGSCLFWHNSCSSLRAVADDLLTQQGGDGLAEPACG
jgi:hypothetical protein